MTSRALLLLLLAALPGCSVLTVESTSGTDELPADLRSSSDDHRPTVGMADVPTTQPGMVGKVKAITVDAPVAIYEMITANKAIEAAQNLQNRDAEVRRASIVRIAGRSYGNKLPYTDVYRTYAASDSDALVRATSVRAINRSRDLGANIVLIGALGDGSPQVRLEAAKALANMPTPGAEVPLRKLATDNTQDPDIRIAALDALRHYPSLDTQRALVSQLNSNNFALAWQARRSLYLQTNQDFRYNEADWLNYLASK